MLPVVSACWVLGSLRQEELEEVAADTFAALWEHAGELEQDRGNLRAWLKTVAANKAKNRLHSYVPNLPIPENVLAAGASECQAEERAAGEFLRRAAHST